LDKVAIKIITANANRWDWIYWKIRAIYFFCSLFNAPPYSQNYSFGDMWRLISKNSEQKNYRLYAALHRGQLVGMYECMQLPEIIDEQNIAIVQTAQLPLAREWKCYYTFQMGVLKPYRRHHVGRKMFLKMLHDARIMHYTHAVLWTDYRPSPAQEFWRNNGYAPLPKIESLPEQCQFFLRKI